MDLKLNLLNIQKRITQACERAGRHPDEVTLLAVSKYVSDEAVESLARLGVKSFGESRIQQARNRLERFPDLNWHFIGSLQTNKVKYAQGFSLIHSLDRLALAQEVNARAQQWNGMVDMLIQVNISEEISKHGVPLDQLNEFASRLSEFANINVRGLMGMAPFVVASETRSYFRRLNELQEELKLLTNWSMDILSMGMSNDFEIAIEEGSTLIRVGTALFGEEG